MSDATRILSQIEEGDGQAAEQLLPLVYDELRADGRSEIEADDLVERASALLEQRAGPVVASRWRAWRHAKRVQRPIVLAIAGAPGVGKSTVATRLAMRLEITRIVTTDTIREVLRTVNSANQDVDAGVIRGDVVRYEVRTLTRFQTADEIAALRHESWSGDEFRLARERVQQGRQGKVRDQCNDAQKSHAGRKDFEHLLSAFLVALHPGQRVARQPPLLLQEVEHLRLDVDGDHFSFSSDLSGQ